MKDTKFERIQHEATGRHQGNLKRFLRSIQNDHEKDDREKQRAKSEVERLNRAVGGSSIPPAQGAYPFKQAVPSNALQPNVTDRKRQMAQLAGMGIAVPDEYRGDMALPGDWQVLSQKPIELDQQNGSQASLSVGIRKRKFEGLEEEEEAGETVKKKGWGSTTKEYPTTSQNAVDSLLAGGVLLKKEESKPDLKQEDHGRLADHQQVCHDPEVSQDTFEITTSVQIKLEDIARLPSPSNKLPDGQPEATPDSLEIVFKKRKSKKIPQN